jgi:hypothetical protein
MWRKGKMVKNFEDIPDKKDDEKEDEQEGSAMEFLMTYGWAILVVIAAIAALAYFGVIPPKDNSLLPGEEPMNTTTGEVHYFPNVTCAEIKADEKAYNLTGKSYDCADNYKEIVTNESLSRVIVK